uniref:Uncharacterized protein n=1 Tax=Aegilops tauschii TaxID=37682 RepID=M8BZA3_AEGTA
MEAAHDHVEATHAQLVARRLLAGDPPSRYSASSIQAGSTCVPGEDMNVEVNLLPEWERGVPPPPPKEQQAKAALPRVETEEERRARKKREYEKQKVEDRKQQQMMRQSQATILQKTQQVRAAQQQKQPQPQSRHLQPSGGTRVATTVSRPASAPNTERFRNELPDPSAQLKWLPLNKDKDR